MAYELTPEQAQAVHTIDRDVLVTAGAGSGKTRVLVQRFLHLLDVGVPLESICAITFTRKAAQEMRQRIRDALQEHPQLHHLAPQMVHARIATIHGLCTQIIREHPREARVDPGFRVAEEWEAAVLLRDTAVGVLRTQLSQGDDALQDIREETRTVRDAADRLSKLYESMLGGGWQSFDFGNHEAALKNDLQTARRDLQQAMEILLAFVQSPQCTTTEKQRERLDTLAELWQQESTALTGDFNADLAPALAALKKAAQGNWSKLKPSLEPLQQACQRTIDLLEDLEGEKRLQSLGRFFSQLDADFKQVKQNLGISDFNDLEIVARRLLAADDGTAGKRSFKHIMVDEFQDTNGIQKNIIDSLRGPDSILFVVGDPKQSIYRFRSAEVQVFFDAKEEFEANGGIVVHLPDNFRSQPPLLAFCDEFFEPLMKKDLVMFQSSRARRTHSCTPAVELVVVEADGRTKSEARAAEAAAVAAHIFSAAQAGAEYGKMALLFRATTNMKLYERALLKLDIPFVNASARGFYSTQEVQDVLALTTWVDDPLDETAAAAVLRSPFFLVSDAGLFWYRQGQPKMASKQDRQAIAAAVDLRAQLAAVAAAQPAPLVFRELFHKTTFLDRIAAQPRAVQQVANVLKLEEGSWELWNKGFITMQEQRHYIAQLLQGRDLEGEARLSSEQEDAVLLMTIHGAKGLEYPIVYLPDLNREQRYRNELALEYHPRLGVGYKKTSRGEAVRAQNVKEEIEESKRLLYVAATRAEDKLIFCGIADDAKSREKSYAELLTWWDWLSKAQAENNMQAIPRWGPAEAETALRAFSSRNTQPAASGKQRTPPEPSGVQPAPLQPWRTALPGKLVPDQIRLSVTALLQYERCPRCFYCRYILRIPESASGVETVSEAAAGRAQRAGLGAAQRGTILHWVCERLHGQESVDELLKKAILLENTAVSYRERNDLRRVAERYRQSETFQRSLTADCRREWPFTVTLDNYAVSGTIDQIVASGKEVVIVDLKSNAIHKEQALETAGQYRRQLQLYAWALATLEEAAVQKLQIHFLVPNTVVDIPWQAEDKIRLTEWVRQTFCEIVEQQEQGSDAFERGTDCGPDSLCSQLLAVKERKRQ